MSLSSELSLSFGLSHQNLVHFSLLSHACHMPCLPHSPWLGMERLLRNSCDTKLSRTVSYNFSFIGNAAIFNPEKGDSMFLRNVDFHARVYTASQPRRITSSSSPSRENEIFLCADQQETDETSCIVYVKWHLSLLRFLCEVGTAGSTRADVKFAIWRFYAVKYKLTYRRTDGHTLWYKLINTKGPKP
jgi:hypothetical protein